VSGRVPVTSHQLSRVVTFYGPDRWRRPPCAFGLSGPGRLDARLVQSALSLLPWRHAALRSYFPASAVDGYGFVSPEPVAEFPMTAIDIPASAGTADPRDRERAGLRLLCEPFDLGKPPLYRAVSFRHPDHTMLGVAVDHAIFAEEFVFLYRALAAGAAPAGLTAEVSDFAVFAAAERDWSSSPEAGEAIEYWRPRWRRFGAFPDPGLPSTIAAAPGPGTSRSWQRRIPARQFTAVTERARSRRVTPFIVAAAAVFAALRERTGADHHALIVPYARRDGRPGEGLGNYSNRVLLTVDEPDMANSERLLERVAEAAWSALQHGMMPFEDLIKLTTDDAFTRPKTPYLHVNFVTLPGPFYLDGTALEFTWLEDDQTYTQMSSALFVTLELEPSGGAVLTCGHDTACYAADVVDEFMSTTERHLTG
jgi:Condensation domain